MTTRKVEIHPEALIEAGSAIAWYGERSSHAPQAFIAELDKAIDAILAAPKRWPVFEETCRRYPLVRFPYYVVYSETSSGGIMILAVSHGRRKPGYWKSRRA
jgi:plasmid stabilization system protein ParE